MAKKSSGLRAVLNFVMWLTGILVSLAVGFGMIGETLTIPYIQAIVPFFGWVVVIATLLSLVLAIAHRFQ